MDVLQKPGRNDNMATTLGLPIRTPGKRLRER
jgi:hypothetical protein